MPTQDQQADPSHILPKLYRLALTGPQINVIQNSLAKMIVANQETLKQGKLIPPVRMMRQGNVDALKEAREAIAFQVLSQNNLLKKAGS